MLISINRKIFKSLDKDLQKTYVQDIVDSLLRDKISESDYDTVTEGICGLITSLENVIEDVGYAKWYNASYPASKEVCGFWHQTGRYSVSFFDLGAEKDDPESIDYSFEIWEMI